MIQGELTYLGGGVFGGTKWFSEHTDWVIVQEKFLQTYKGSDTELVIPNGVEVICDRAFSNKKYFPLLPDILKIPVKWVRETTALADITARYMQKFSTI